jgi:hypothetical protein
MADLKKTLLYILSVIGAAISYVPAAIYAYFYSEFFTKYHSFYEDAPTDKSDSEIATIKPSRMP